jgi:hypothetical protein
MNRIALMAIGILAASGASAADVWAGAGGAADIGTAAAVGGIVEVGAQEDWFGLSADVHLNYNEQTLKPTYAAFANLRVQAPIFLHPYVIAGVGLGNNAPLYNDSAQFLWRVGAGLRFSPLPILYIDGQVGVISLTTEYLQIGVGVTL